MIPHTELQWQTLPWQRELREAIRSPLELLEFLGLKAGDCAPLNAASATFSTLVPRSFARLMKPGDPLDPLLLQVLPAAGELASPEGYTLDPLREAEKNPVPGLIHKYHGRVLLIAAPGCAVNCRYCFRRHFEYSANSPSRDNWPKTLEYIAADKSITEVILSGGDPLLLGDDWLADLIASIEAIGHVQRLRIHSRMPVVLPSRITAALCTTLAQSRLRPVMVIHSNHGNEIGGELADAMARLAAAQVTLLNQSVLLAGINDSADTLAALSQALFDVGVMPYYLHLLDRVSGAAHFDVPEPRALAIHRQLLGRCSGYLVPRLVRESPDQPSKIPLAPYS